MPKIFSRVSVQISYTGSSWHKYTHERSDVVVVVLAGVVLVVRVDLVDRTSADHVLIS